MKLLLNLSMKCWNSASNAQGLSSENICSSSEGTQEKEKDRMKLNLPPKLLEKLV
jgi:hypothetical protein